MFGKKISAPLPLRKVFRLIRYFIQPVSIQVNTVPCKITTDVDPDELDPNPDLLYDQNFTTELEPTNSV
jgi:hypothetical protein